MICKRTRDGLVRYIQFASPIAFGMPGKFDTLGSLNAGCPVVSFEPKVRLFETNFIRNRGDFIATV